MKTTCIRLLTVFFLRKRALSSTSSEFTVQVSDSYADRNLCCLLRDNLKQCIQSSLLRLHLTEHDFELYQIPIITGTLNNLHEIVFDGVMRSPACFMEAIDGDDFTHKNVFVLIIRCILSVQEISVLLQWFPSTQHLEIKLDNYHNEREQREILLMVSKMRMQKVRMKAIFHMKRKRSETIEWLRTTINHKNGFDEHDAYTMYSLEKQPDSIILCW
jgi:hypothetical protein